MNPTRNPIGSTPRSPRGVEDTSPRAARGSDAPQPFHRRHAMTCAHSPQRDRAFGRYFARNGAHRVLREAEHAPPNRDRITRWRIAYARVPIEQTLQRIRR